MPQIARKHNIRAEHPGGSVECPAGIRFVAVLNREGMGMDEELFVFAEDSTRTTTTSSNMNQSCNKAGLSGFEFREIMPCPWGA